MSFLLRTIFIFLLITENNQCANILGLFPVPGFSFFKVFQPVLEKLAERGHKVDVFSHFPVENPIPGYTDLSVRGSIKTNLPFDIKPQRFETTLQLFRYMLNMAVHEVCITVGNTKVAQELMKTTKKYDVIITQLYCSDCLLGYAHIFKVPIIALTSSANLPWASDFIGLPDNPSYIPNIYSSYTENMSLLQRLQNMISLWALKFWYHYYALEESNKYSKQIFGDDMVHTRNLVKNFSLVMVNSHFSLHQSRPMTPNFIEIGGVHIPSNPELPKNFEEYLKTDLKGVIFLSFGTLLNSETFSEDKLVALFESFRTIPYKVLWKGDRSKIPKHLAIPSNVHFISWAPQVALLCHPKLKLFISHCGLSSTQESIHCGKPILGFPVWIDQAYNGNIIASKGIGITFSFFDITKEKVSNALTELLNNPMYETNMKTFSRLFLDRPISAMDTAVYWTEYVIRHKGAPHLRPKSADLKWYTYYCLDVILISVIVALVLFICLFTLVRRLKRIVCKKLEQKYESSKKEM